jgi:CHAD domain-containing protein
MAEAEQILTTEVEPPAAKQPQQRQPRSLVEIITSQLAVLHTHYRAVLDTEGVEAVHKMRVTTRRLQASLDLLERAQAEEAASWLATQALQRQKLRRLSGTH